MNPVLRALVLTTITAPRDAVRQILSFHVPAQAQWLAIGLAAAMNALAFQVGQLPLDPEARGLPVPLPEGGNIFVPVSGLNFLFTNGVLLAVACFALLWAGRAFGGRASLTEICVLLAWQQVLFAAIRIAVLFLFFVSPLLAGFAFLIVNVLNIWVAVQFVYEGHRLSSVWKALAVLIAAFVGVIIVMMPIVSRLLMSAMGGL